MPNYRGKKTRRTDRDIDRGKHRQAIQRAKETVMSRHRDSLEKESQTKRQKQKNRNIENQIFFGV